MPWQHCLLSRRFGGVVFGDIFEKGNVTSSREFR